MASVIQVTCPCCRTTLEVNPVNGRVVQHWKPVRHDAGADVLEDTLQKIRADKEARGTLFESAKDKLGEKKKKAEDLFKKEIERLKTEDDGTPPMNPMDLD
ncbi:MAG: hypothetical protein V1809_10850 [Planctomycetota bacterium]